MALIRYLPLRPSWRFLDRKKFFLGFSVALTLLSVVLLSFIGLNFGVDFRGGILLEIESKPGVTIQTFRKKMESLDVGDTTLQEFGHPEHILLQIEQPPMLDKSAQIAVIASVKEALAEHVSEYRRTEFVGPKVSGELKKAGILTTLLSLLGIAAYIWFRFELHFSFAALAALIHDVCATLGFYALTQIEFNLATLAAILTVAGYSINDTVVVFDRVRETLRKFKTVPLPKVLDRAINETLSRTLMTSLTTLLALFALYILGGEALRGFTAGLIFGVIIGTYSSVCLATPLLSFFQLRGAPDHPTSSA